MDEKGPEIEDPFRRFRRLPERPKRPGDSSGERPVPQWKGPVPPPRSSGVFPVAGDPGAQDSSTEQRPVPPAINGSQTTARAQWEASSGLFSPASEVSPFSLSSENGAQVSEEARASRHALLADIAARFEQRSAEAPHRKRQTRETPQPPAADRPSGQTDPVRTPTNVSGEAPSAPNAVSVTSGEVAASAERPSGELVIPPWKPADSLTAPQRNSGELSVHRQAAPLPKRGSGQIPSGARQSGEITAARRTSGQNAAARASGEVPVAPAVANAGDATGLAAAPLPDPAISPSQNDPENDYSFTGPATPPTVNRRRRRSRSTDRTPRDNWTGAILVGALSLALVAYAFNIASLQGAAKGYLEGLVSSGEGASIAASLARALPWLLLMPVLVLFYGILHTLLGLIGLRRKKQRTTARRRRQKSPFDLFKAAALAQGIPARIAYQGFQILQPHVPEGRTLGLGDSLETDLGLAPAVIRSLRLALLMKTDRDSDPGMRLLPAETVIEMLQTTLQAPRRAAMPSKPVNVPGDPRSPRR